MRNFESSADLFDARQSELAPPGATPVVTTDLKAIAFFCALMRKPHCCITYSDS